MRNIDTTQIVDPTAEQPFTGRSLKFKQDYDAENLAGIIETIITQNLGSYSLSTGYIISGCVVTHPAAYEMTAGEIYYDGKYYKTTAITGSTNPPRLILTKTQDATADPVKFTDLTSKNVHDIFTYVATDVASGGILGSALVSAYGAGKLTVDVQAVNQITTSNTYADLALATYTTPNDGKTRTWIINSSSTISFTPITGNTTGGKMRLYDGTTTLAECEFKFSTSTTGVSGTVSCGRVMSIPPNTTVKVQILSLINTSGNVNFNDNQFSMLEV